MGLFKNNIAEQGGARVGW